MIVCIGSWQLMSQLIPKAPPVIINNFCGSCGNGLSAQDNFCRCCGTQAHCVTPVDLYSAESSSTAIAGRGQQLSSSAGAIQTVLNNRWYVAMVIALIGPLGLPALWFSPRFSRRSKIAGTLVFVVMTTVVPLAVAWYFLDHRLRPVVEALGG